ncbi:MAG: ketopantoate reductase family protein [Rhodospirillales bacterium]
MKICVVGAGAIGGMIAAYLARAGHEVSAVARGDHLRAIAANGLTLLKGEERFTARCRAAEDPDALGPQDYVFIALKAHAVGPMLPRLAPLLGPDTAVVPALNGIPWWYFHREGGKFDGEPVRAVDPDGAMLKALDSKRILGCVVYPAAEIAAPGVVRQTTPEAAFALGEPDRRVSPRATALAAAMTGAGMRTTASADIREAVWTKLLGNVSFNPVAALALMRMDRIFAEPGLVALVRAIMVEVMAVGHAYGIAFPMDADKRLEIARGLGRGRPSMLQDVERGRKLEVEAIVGAVVELARRVGVPTPATDAVHALIAARDAALAGRA